MNVCSQRAHRRSCFSDSAAALQPSEQNRPNPRFSALGQMSKVRWQASHARATRVRRACPLHRREQKRPTRAPERNSRGPPQDASAHVPVTGGLRNDAATQAGEQNRLAAWRRVTMKPAPHHAQILACGQVRSCAARKQVGEQKRPPPRSTADGGAGNLSPQWPHVQSIDVRFASAEQALEQ